MIGAPAVPEPLLPKANLAAGLRTLPSALLLLVLVFLAGSAHADDGGRIDRLKADLRSDFRYHYSPAVLANVAIGFGITGVLAQSRFDGEVQQVFRDDLQGNLGDGLNKFFGGFGDAALPLPAAAIYAGAMWFGDYGTATESATGRWGGNSLRAMVIGVPELLVLSNIAGGHRPEEGEPGWHPFNDDNGVSGHAFFGALPLITAARMSDSRWLRYTLYSVSAMPGLARVYDDKHYFSQAFMGWWLAFAASRSIEHTNTSRRHDFMVEPVALEAGAGLQVNLNFR